MDCPSCGRKMIKDLCKDEADELMKSWGVDPFPHNDFDCSKCGCHLTVDPEGEVLTSSMRINK